MLSDRDRAIDSLRGFAIFVMIGANMAPSVMAQPYPFGLRLYGSFAAPLFILLSGMMVSLTAKAKGHPWRYFLLRGAMIVMGGVFVDVVVWNGVCPFVGVDVLYLIGLSVPLTFLFLRFGSNFQWLIILMIFILTPLLQKLLGYTEYVNPILLWGEEITTVPVKTHTGILNHWIVDGWFPIFPWLGFSFLGVKLGFFRWKYPSFETFGKKSILLLGLGILTLGSIVWWFCPGDLLTREGSIELFYPPTMGYILTAVGLILILFYIVDLNPLLSMYAPLQPLGEASLFMYLIHLPLIEYVISPLWSNQRLEAFLLLYLSLSVFLILIAYGVRYLKKRWRTRPFFIRFLLGG